MNRRKIFVAISLSIFGFIILFYLTVCFIFKEETRELGELVPSCSKNTKIKIIHESEFDHAQGIYYEIYENENIIKPRRIFATTDDKYEKLESFEIRCVDNVAFIKFKNENNILLLYDLNSKEVFPNHNRTENTELIKQLLSIIKKENNDYTFRE